MDYVISGNIAPNVSYYVVTNSITYNSIVVNVGSTFVGISGIITFTGTGQVVDEFTLSDLSTELVDRVWEGVYPEQLEMYNFESEIVQNQNGTIYPERLELYNFSTELDGKRKGYVMIAYSMN